MKLTMLGTGHALTFKCFNTCFILEENDQLFLVDGGGGNGLFNQIEATGYDWKNIRTVFVTHKHTDHILGILWYIRMVAYHMLLDEFDGEATIYTHEEPAALLQDMAEKLLRPAESGLINKRIHLVVLEDGDEFEAMGCKAVAFDIDSHKAKQFGFTLYYGEGKKLTCCGDEPFNPCYAKYAQDSDWLLHEAFCLHSEADIYHPYEISHSTAKDACETASKLGVKNIILYHTEDEHINERKELYAAEGKQVFAGQVLVPNDLEVINL